MTHKLNGTAPSLLPLLALLLVIVSPALLRAIEGASSCSLTPDQLKARRLQVAAEFSDRVNHPVETYISVTEKYMSVDGSLTVDFVGTFGPRFVGIEYGTLVYAGEVNMTFGKIYPDSVRWLDDNTVLYSTPYGYKKDFYGNLPPFQYSSSIQNVVESEVLVFDPDSCENPIILRDIIIDNPITRALSEASGRVQSTSVPDICYAIQNLACPEGSPHQQFTDINDCIDFFSIQVPSSSIQGLCPQPFSSKTLLCALIHLTSAFIDPTVHCPHIGKQSAPCQDRCVSECSSCALLDQGPYPVADPSTNAFCDTNYVNYITPGYRCKCLDGTVSRDDLSPVAGRTYCQPITCSTDRDCPVRRGSATCVSGKCVPRPGFVWNSTLVANQNRDMSQCPYGRSRIFKKDGLSYCVQPGYCLPNSTNAVQCAPLYDLRKVSCSALDTQDFGVPASIPKRMWGCVCNDGYEGGMGFACTCPSPKVERFDFRTKRFICTTPRPHGPNYSQDEDEDEDEDASV